jgi:hypothetical protein
MDASTAKDRFTVIWIHPIPAQLSIQEFSAKMEAQVDSLLALSSAQNNLLRYDLVGLPMRLSELQPDRR